MKPHILIVGHGYVGAALAADLRSDGIEVSAASLTGDDRFSYPVHSVDVSSRDSVTDLRQRLDRMPDRIVHCVSSGRGGAVAYRAHFIDGTEALLSTFPGAPILFTSSTSVYGQTDGSLVTEASPTEPDRETSEILLAAEKLVCENGGTVARLAGIYGPGRSIYLKRILNGTAAIESGTVSRYLNQIHRADAASAIAFLIESAARQSAGRIFNVCDNTAITQRECYERLAAYFEQPKPPETPPETERKRAWTNKIVSNAALRDLGWGPRYPSFLGALDEDPELVPSIREIVNETPDSSSRS